MPYPEETETEVPSPQRKNYPDFFLNEVIPFINKIFRIKTGYKNTGLGGSSYGGYIALYTYLARPIFFAKLLLESTPFFLSNNQIIKDAALYKKWQGKILIGTKESPDESINLRGRNSQDSLIRILEKNKSKIQYKSILTEGSHNQRPGLSDCPWV